MKKNKCLGLRFLLILIMLLFSGCGGTILIPTATVELLSPTNAQEPTNIPTLIPPTATSKPTAMLPATRSVTKPATTPAKMLIDPVMEWHLVVISDSSGWGLGAAFASQIENDVGVKVIVDDFAIGGLSAGDVLDELQTGTSSVYALENLPTALTNADVVLLFPSPMRSLDNDAFMSFQRCFGNAMGTPAPCKPQGSEKYTADLDTIWAKVFELRLGKPTILRALDAASPFVNRWNENHVFEIFTGCWECYSATSRKAAEALDIPFLSRYDIYNGPGHNLDLEQQGYIGGDGVHPNGLAQQYTAELLSQLGYDPVTPP